MASSSRQSYAPTYPSTPSRSPGRSIRTPSGSHAFQSSLNQQHGPPAAAATAVAPLPTNFAPSLPSTVFAADPAFRANLEADLSALDFALRQLLTAKTERRRVFEAELADLIEEGKKLDRDRARLESKQVEVAKELEREKAEVDAAQHVVKGLEGRQRAMKEQLTALLGEIEDWQRKVEQKRSGARLLISTY